MKSLFYTSKPSSKTTLTGPNDIWYILDWNYNSIFVISHRRIFLGLGMLTTILRLRLGLAAFRGGKTKRKKWEEKGNVKKQERRQGRLTAISRRKPVTQTSYFGERTAFRTLDRFAVIQNTLFNISCNRASHTHCNCLWYCFCCCWRTGWRWARRSVWRRPRKRKSLRRPVRSRCTAGRITCSVTGRTLLVRTRRSALSTRPCRLYSDQTSSTHCWRWHRSTGTSAQTTTMSSTQLTLKVKVKVKVVSVHCLPAAATSSIYSLDVYGVMQWVQHSQRRILFLFLTPLA